MLPPRFPVADRSTGGGARADADPGREHCGPPDRHPYKFFRQRTFGPRAAGPRQSLGLTLVSPAR